MASRFATIQIIHDSSDSSVVGLALYQSRGRGHRRADETGDIYDFTQKPGHVHGEMLLPPGAPERYQDPLTFWREVEAAEWVIDPKTKEMRRRKSPKGEDSAPQTAFSVLLAMPKELDHDLQLEMARDFARQYVDQGAAVQIDLHAPHPDDGNPLDNVPIKTKAARAKLSPEDIVPGGDDSDNDHVHMIVSMRKVTENGLGKKIRNMLDQSFCNGHRIDAGSKKPDEIWAKFQEEWFAARGLDIHVPTRRLVGRETTIKPGARREAEAKSIADSRAAVMENPKSLVDRLVETRGYFSARDFRLEMERLNLTEAEEEGVRKTVAQLVVCLTDPKLGNRAAKTIYTTREMLIQQRDAVTRIRKMGAVKRTFEHAAKIRMPPEAAEFQRSAEQNLAIKLMLSASQFIAVRGAAGAGKSTVAIAARNALLKAGLSCILLAPSNSIVADGIKDGWTDARTINAFVYGVEKGRIKPPDVIFLDEAAMTDGNMLARLAQIAQTHGCLVRTVGDEAQLESVHLAGLWAAVRKDVPTLEIKKVIRQRNADEAEATEMFGAGDVSSALKYHLKAGNVQFCAGEEEQLRSSAKWILDDPADWTDKLLLAPRNALCDQTNTYVQAARFERGELGQDFEFLTDRGSLVARVGDRIVVRENGKRSKGTSERPWNNGDLGVFVRADEGGITVKLDRNGTEVYIQYSDDPKTPLKVSLGYAVTVHKAQGRTKSAVGIIHDWCMSSSQLEYVAASRHRDRMRYFTASANAEEFISLAQRNRASTNIAELLETPGAVDELLNRSENPQVRSRKRKAAAAVEDGPGATARKEAHQRHLNYRLAVADFAETASAYGDDPIFEDLQKLLALSEAIEAEGYPQVGEINGPHIGSADQMIWAGRSAYAGFMAHRLDRTRSVVADLWADFGASKRKLAILQQLNECRLDVAERTKLLALKKRGTIVQLEGILDAHWARVAGDLGPPGESLEAAEVAESNPGPTFNPEEYDLEPPDWEPDEAPAFEAESLDNPFDDADYYEEAPSVPPPSLPPEFNPDLEAVVPSGYRPQ